MLFSRIVIVKRPNEYYAISVRPAVNTTNRHLKIL
jgi:hypothetical protein